MSFYTYILFSKKFDKYYIGQTKNIENRLLRHNKGLVTSTAPYRPWSLAWKTTKDSVSGAMTLERKLKNLSKARIKRFIDKYDLTDGSPDDGKTMSGC